MAFSKQPLVSIISPCYNSEKWVGRMLESILAQTYKNIEMICVDDGSTDNTAAVIASFYDRFAENGMSLRLLSQPNLGQTAAMNTGFKVFSGEYISWIDCDDFFMPESVDKKLSLLKDNNDIGIVTSNYAIVHESNVNKIIGVRGDSFGGLSYQRNQFYLVLLNESIFESGCHLVRKSCFENAFPQREIRSCCEGQNLQLILPLYYLYPRMYINEPLMHYVIRDNSHCHRQRTENEKKERNERIMEMLKAVFVDLKINKRDTLYWLKRSYVFRSLLEN